MAIQSNPNIRNIAIIAHVDHGKTTLVDQMFQQSGLIQSHQAVDDRIMDNMDLEKERGITIAAKNCSILYKDIKINIIDTPGHADFGGEVERSLGMTDGVILLVDSAEGPLPQTRFVLQKALNDDLKIIVVVNKIDRKDARAQEVLDEIYNLFIDLDANDQQIDFPVLYAIGRDGIAQKELDTPGTNLSPLFDEILNTIPAPKYDDQEPFQMLVSNIGYSDYTGRLAIGRVFQGNVKKNDQLAYIQAEDQAKNLKVSSLQVYDGIKIVETEQVQTGDIAILSGANEVQIGDTICHKDNPKAMPRIKVDDPTISMKFLGNNSPFSGQEGKFSQTQRIVERLKKEILFNVAIQIEETTNNDYVIVKGRGEFQMAVLIETMRREGYELCVGRPQIIFKEEDGVKLEPIENLIVECDDEFTGIVTEKISKRKGRMQQMLPFGEGRKRLEFSISSRGLIGYRNEFLTDTRGTGLMTSYLDGYEPFRGEIVSRQTGSLVADRDGQAIAYALFNLEDRGRMFVQPGEKVYTGMVIGEHSRDNDLDVNVTKGKKLTNMRASGKDEAVVLTPIQSMTLEQAIDFINDDEWIEVTPQNIRLRKIHLDPIERRIEKKKQKS
ncbi:GTP-binding protein TypA [bacterium K02(2017)]|nr:GTP-binding protein TypA [bacterium K02(2017)]